MINITFEHTIDLELIDGVYQEPINEDYDT